MSEDDLNKMIEKFRGGMVIKDRKYLGKPYQQCFIGKEAVDWLVGNSQAKNRKEATQIGNLIMEKKVFQHVLSEHKFKDKDLFYIMLPDTTSPKNLFTRLGGKVAIAAVVDDFVERLKVNKTLLANMAVKHAFEKVSVPGLKYSITELVCMATGGPQTYTGLSMRDSHAGLKINEQEWNAFAEDFTNTLNKFKVPEKERGELFMIVGSLKGDIVVSESLYSRLGGIAGVATVVDDFIERILVNPVLNANPHLKTANETANKAGFKYMVAELVASATGGPQKYTGKSMKQAHKNMQITDKEWDAFAGDFKATLDKFTVPPKEQGELFAIVGSLKGDVVQGATVATKSLYDRLGGFHGVAAVVDDFIDRITTDFILNANPIIKELNIKSVPPAFKYSVTELVCQVTGGPQKYTGKGMKESHKDMKITDKEWYQFVALFKQTLDKFKVPLQEQTELVNIVASLKGDIVTV